MSDIIFSEDAWEEYLYWASGNKNEFKKINALLKETQRTPFTGTGKPEPLKGDMSGAWSRRINRVDRLVYRMEENGLYVIQCKGHYDNK